MRDVRPYTSKGFCPTVLASEEEQGRSRDGDGGEGRDRERDGGGTEEGRRRGGGGTRDGGEGRERTEGEQRRVKAILFARGETSFFSLRPF